MPCRIGLICPYYMYQPLGRIKLIDKPQGQESHNRRPDRRSISYPAERNLFIKNIRDHLQPDIRSRKPAAGIDKSYRSCCLRYRSTDLIHGITDALQTSAGKTSMIMHRPDPEEDAPGIRIPYRRPLPL